MRAAAAHEDLIPSLPKEEVRGVWLSPLARRDIRAAPVEILGAAFGEFVDLALVEVVSAIDDLLLDRDALLGLELVNQLLHRRRRRHAVLVAVDDQARGRAGGEEREVVEVLRRAHRDESFDLRAAHQELHADPGAEREAGAPAAAALTIERLQPVERRRRVRQFADAVVEQPLAAADATRIEAQDRKAAFREHIEQVVDDLVVHRAAEFRVRMEHDRDRRVRVFAGLVAPLEAAFGPVENYFWHRSFPLAEAGLGAGYARLDERNAAP